MWTPQELEQLICGQKSLDFTELKEYCVYANGFQPESELIRWFWEIVLEELSDQQRADLLTFSTGSDRTPINGFKSMEFVIVKADTCENQDEKLPTAHSCFNQLVIPQYSSKDILRKKLLVAIENSTGFGMV